MKKIFLIVTTFITFYSVGQNTDVIDERVFKSSEIIFYGYDFSHFKLAEGGRLDQPNFIKYIPAWFEYLNERKDENDLARRFQKDTVIFKFEYTLSLIDSMTDYEFVSVMKHSILSDSIQNILNNYNIETIDGIGFTIIVECFEKRTETVTAYFVFFDIESKNLLMSDHFGTNKAGGFGLTTHWGEGLNKTFNKYISKVYKKRIKSYLEKEE